MTDRSRDERLPRLVSSLVEICCRDSVQEEVSGDLAEAYADYLDRYGPRRALAAILFETLLCIRPHTIRRRSKSGGRAVLLRNHLTVGIRSMRRQPAFSAINLAGLAIGLATAFLLFLFVRDERSFDRYHPDAGRIYRMVSGHSDEGYDGIAKVGGPWGVTAASQVPGIEAVARFVFFGQALIEVGDRREYAVDPADPSSGGFLADSTVFSVFSWSLRQGDPATAMVAPRSMVVTRSFASHWFGGEDPMGRTLRMGGTEDYRITGVMDDVPRNSHFRFDFLVAMSGYEHPDHDDWVRWNQYYTYLKLVPGADPDRIAAQASDVVAGRLTAEQTGNAWRLALQPLTDIYLRSNMFREIADMGDQGTVSMLGLLAVFILAIAVVNFVNITTARATNRTREVGVRKSLGAGRSVLVRQFLTEAILTVLIAMVIAAGLAALLLGRFNELAGKGFTTADLTEPALVVGALLAVLGIGLTAGFYPAWILSAFDPARALRRGAGGRQVLLRRALVVGQFTISAGLMICTGVVSDQLQFVRRLPLGFEQDHLVTIPIRDPSLIPVYESLKTEMAAVPGVRQATLSGNQPGGGDWGIPIEIPGIEPDRLPPVRMLVGDADFVSTYGVEVVRGRAMDPDRGTDMAEGLLINETMARRLGWDEPLGREVLMPAIGRRFTVIGVVRDFHFRSAHEVIAPLMVFAASNDWYNMLTLRLDPERVNQALDGLGVVYSRFDPVNPMMWSFVDEQFSGLYRADHRLAALLDSASVLAIIIACLGLFGLALYHSERRSREISIRKVVGAGQGRLVGLLSLETALLASGSLVVAIPLSIWLMGGWLETFAYREVIRWVTVAGASAVVFAVAVATTGIQAWRASGADPVRVLRAQ